VDELRRALDFAVEKEREAQAFYRSWAERADNPGVRALFEQLASWEQGHVEKLSRITPDELTGSRQSTRDMKLSELLVSVEAAPEMSLQEAFIVAMKREQASVDLYRGMAAVGGTAGELFSGLEEEERGHKRLLEEEYEAVFLADN